MLVGKLADKKRVSFMGRNIPAYAGKTSGRGGSAPHWAEHPRVRGENSWPIRDGKPTNGTSPRTRGKPATASASRSKHGNIPAHAGKTLIVPIPAGPSSEHPRARGENANMLPPAPRPCGTSPRARVRGENSPTPKRGIRALGTSPRAQGKQQVYS